MNANARPVHPRSFMCGLPPKINNIHTQFAKVPLCVFFTFLNFCLHERKRKNYENHELERERNLDRCARTSMIVFKQNLTIYLPIKRQI